MMHRSMYSSVSRARKNTAKTVAIVLGIVVVLLIAFIIWCVAVYSSGGFTSQADEISALKIQLEQKEQENTALKEQVTRLEEQKRQLESNAPVQEPNTTPPPTQTPTPTPTRTPTRSPARTATPTPTPSTPTPTPPPVQSSGQPEAQSGNGPTQQQ